MNLWNQVKTETTVLKKKLDEKTGSVWTFPAIHTDVAISSLFLHFLSCRAEPRLFIERRQVWGWVLYRQQFRTGSRTIPSQSLRNGVTECVEAWQCEPSARMCRPWKLKDILSWSSSMLDWAEFTGGPLCHNLSCLVAVDTSCSPPHRVSHYLICHHSLSPAAHSAAGRESLCLLSRASSVISPLLIRFPPHW